MADHSDTARNFLTKASIKVAELMGKYLPEPEKGKAALALQIAIVFDLGWSILTFLFIGVFAGIANFVIITAIILLGMYAGVAAFSMIDEKKRNTGGNPAGGPTN